MKYTTKKREKLKDKSQKIYNLLYDLAQPKEEQQGEEEVDNEPEEVEPEVDNEVHENTSNYFESDYPNKEPAKEISEPKLAPVSEVPQYKQEYEAKIDQIGGLVRLSSRRDRLNFKNFNIW